MLQPGLPAPDLAVGDEDGNQVTRSDLGRLQGG
jgi:hypothetical protein